MKKYGKQYFEGRYYKHQKGDRTLSLIVGRAGRESFIQVITENGSVTVPMQPGNHVSNRGIRLNLETPELTVRGAIRYHRLSPIAGDIMGPFRFFPMECRHSIVSMRHRLTGSLTVNGERLDFTGGLGYIEGDSGCSFPSSYTWIQANDFPETCAVVAAVARIPCCGLHFRGCICVIQYRGREYRLATYLGVRVLACTSRRIVLVQGPCRLEIRIHAGEGFRLAAPQKGKMERTIRETVSCPAEFHFSIRGKTVFRMVSHHASFEYEEEDGVLQGVGTRRRGTRGGSRCFARCCITQVLSMRGSRGTK